MYKRQADDSFAPSMTKTYARAAGIQHPKPFDDIKWSTFWKIIALKKIDFNFLDAGGSFLTQAARRGRGKQMRDV